uniref:Transmembrane protein 107 n=1 Tax=Steinernema glaseri TaxID=37863 RepID=A0A1I8AVB0_9BILA
MNGKISQVKYVVGLGSSLDVLLLPLDPLLSFLGHFVVAVMVLTLRSHLESAEVGISDTEINLIQNACSVAASNNPVSHFRSVASFSLVCPSTIIIPIIHLSRAVTLTKLGIA